MGKSDSSKEADWACPVCAQRISVKNNIVPDHVSKVSSPGNCAASGLRYTAFPRTWRADR